MSNTTRSAANPAPFTYTCPHLGMLDDTTTTTAFPSEINHCLHCKPACVPSYQHQQEFCLSQNYSNCPIINLPAPAHLPHSRRWAHDPAQFKAIFIKTAIGVFAAGLLAMFFLLGAPARISQMIQAFGPEATREVYQPVVFSTRTPTPEAPTPYPTATFVISQLEMPTAIPFEQIVKLTVVELEMGTYCRSGPDPSFSSVTILKTGNVLQALARDSVNRYYLVRVPNQIVADCWVQQVFVTAQGDPGTLPVYTPMPTLWPAFTSTPVTPSPTSVEVREPTPKPAAPAATATP